MSEPPFGPRHCMGCRYGYTDTWYTDTQQQLQCCVHLQILELYLTGCAPRRIKNTAQEHNNANGSALCVCFVDLKTNMGYTELDWTGWAGGHITQKWLSPQHGQISPPSFPSSKCLGHALELHGQKQLKTELDSFSVFAVFYFRFMNCPKNEKKLNLGLFVHCEKCAAIK